MSATSLVDPHTLPSGAIQYIPSMYFVTIGDNYPNINLDHIVKLFNQSETLVAIDMGLTHPSINKFLEFGATILHEPLISSLEGAFKFSEPMAVLTKTNLINKG